MKKLTLTIILAFMVSVGVAQSKKNDNYITYGRMDSVGCHSQSDKVVCIAYTHFQSGDLIYKKADTIVRKYEVCYLYKWNNKLKGYYATFGQSPIRFYSGNGETDIYRNTTYWHNGVQIHPIEIITKPVIK